MQSLPLTTNIVSSNLVHGEVYLIQHYVIKFARTEWLATGRWFSPVSSNNETDCYNITKILLKAVLNTITPHPPTSSVIQSQWFQRSVLLMSCWFPPPTRLSVTLYLTKLLWVTTNTDNITQPMSSTKNRVIIDFWIFTN